MKVMIAAGGTGGHIYPALALAKVMQKEKPDTEIVFFGTSDRMEAKVIPHAGYRFYGVMMHSTSGGILNKFRSLCSMMKAYGKAKEILRKEKPDICIGFGNYIEVPFIYAAKSLHIKTMLHEQNSFAGKANKFLAKKVDAIVSCYDANLQQMENPNQRVLGNPQATLAAETTYDPAVLTKLGLDADKPFVFFMMGSLGSASVSKVIDEACPLFDDSYQVVIASGSSNQYQFSYPSNDRIKIVDYVDGKTMLKGCALAVVRAGATTIAEIGAIGCAAIVIPSPYVPNNHQFFNAKALVEQDAAVMLEEADLTPQVLADTVNRLMRDPAKRKEMKERSYAAGKRDAAYTMMEWMGELIR